MKCVTGCKAYTGGEIKHHPDCPFYPESLSKMYDDLVNDQKVRKHSETCVYVITFENDGDFPECEIVLVTNLYKDAVEKAKLRKKDYALSIIWKWEFGKYVSNEIYDEDSKYPDTSKM